MSWSPIFGPIPKLNDFMDNHKVCMEPQCGDQSRLQTWENLQIILLHVTHFVKHLIVIQITFCYNSLHGEQGVFDVPLVC
jgi:hypothetical protein